MCWVYDVAPSHLRPIVWSRTRSDIQTQIQLKVGFNQALIVQSYKSLVSVVSQALGGDPEAAPEEEKPKSTPINPNAAQTSAQAMAQFASVFGQGSVN
jgi:hypothetical protein